MTNKNATIIALAEALDSCLYELRLDQNPGIPKEEFDEYFEDEIKALKDHAQVIADAKSSAPI